MEEETELYKKYKEFVLNHSFFLLIFFFIILIHVIINKLLLFLEIAEVRDEKIYLITILFFFNKISTQRIYYPNAPSGARSRFELWSNNAPS